MYKNKIDYRKKTLNPTKEKIIKIKQIEIVLKFKYSFNMKYKKEHCLVLKTRQNKNVLFLNWQIFIKKTKPLKIYIYFIKVIKGPR